MRVDDRPLVTFAVFAYNQERYIEAAVKAALAQTYSPLQIILSDDCSSDRTFDLMRDMAAQYEGPHEVLLNRNERNLGVAGHVNRLAELARGKIVVLAAGDDVSHPSRVERVAEVFSRSDTIRAVVSGYTEMLESGEVTRDVPLSPDFRHFTDLSTILKSGGWVAMGATFAYHRDCFTTPRPIPSEVLCEDGLLPLRAALLGTIEPIHDPLVLYRVHGTSNTAQARFMTPDYQSITLRVLGEELDFALRAGLIDAQTCNKARSALARWPKYFARSRRLKDRPLLTRLHNAWYFADVWRRRIRSRMSQLPDGLFGGTPPSV